MTLTVPTDFFDIGTLGISKLGEMLRVVTLTDGRILAVWYEGSATIANAPGITDTTGAVLGRIFDANGASPGAVFQVNTREVGAQNLPEVAVLADGGFVVAYQSLENYDGGNEDHDIYAQVFTSAGAKSGAEILVTDDAAVSGNEDWDTNPDVYATADGGFIISWTAGYTDRTMGQVFDSSGAEVGGQADLFDAPYLLAQGAQLANGDVVVVNGNDTLEIRLSDAGLDGAPAGVSGAAEPVVIDRDPNSLFAFYNPSVAALPNGNFVIAYTAYPIFAPQETSKAYIEVFGADGTLLSSEAQDLSSRPTGANVDVQVVVRPDGNFVALWVDYEPGATVLEQTAVVYMQEFAQDGTPSVDGPVEVWSIDLGLGDSIPNPTLTLMASGDLFLGFYDADNYSFSGGTDTLQGTIIESDGAGTGGGTTPVVDGVTKTGNKKDNTLKGSKKGDLLSGEGGNDKLFGKAGDDTLLGGDGRDKLDGGGGDDDLSGGEGKDLLKGQAGNDTLDGGAGRDKLDGGTGDDILTGGTDADVFFFRKNGGNDVITDFTAGEDRVFIDNALWGKKWTKVQKMLNKFVEQDGDDVLFTFGDNTLRILDADLATIADDLKII